MEYVVQTFEIISGIAAAFAIIISIVLYIHGLNRERKLDTLKILAEIRKKYFDTRSLNNKQRLQYLNELEYFSSGINVKLYDIKIVKKMSKNRLIKQYDNWACEFIKYRRDLSGNANAYSEYEKMINELRR